MKEKEPKRLKVLHVITGLHTGGAEIMLYKLLSGMDRRAFEPEVVSLMDSGAVGTKIQGLEIPVTTLGMRRGFANPLDIFRLAGRIRKSRPHCIQTWMYHADLLGGLAARVAGGVPVIWGIRHSNLDPQSTRRVTRWIARACALLSRRLPAGIVCCSEASRQAHAELGYAADRMTVIPNGFDLSAFRPDRQARLSVRGELGLPPEALLIGLVGRYHPDKGHRCFIQAASQLSSLQPEVHFLLCGTGVTMENPELSLWLREAGILTRCHLLGPREDIPHLTASLDIATSSSNSEGFPNVIGEAMACGVPCVVTDVGDAALIVGDTGLVVPPGHPGALAQSWLQLIKIEPEKRNSLGQAARRRIEEYYNLPLIVNRYEKLYKDLALRA